MSREAQQFSSHGRPISFLASPAAPTHPEKIRRPPISFTTRLPKKKHHRSSSFGELVSRILPSWRGEKSCTQSLELNTEPELDLGGFLKNSKAHLQYNASNAVSDGYSAQLTKSWSPSKGSPRHRDDQVDEWAFDDAVEQVDDPVAFFQDVAQRQVGVIDDMQLKKGNLRRIFGSTVIGRDDAKKAVEYEEGVAHRNEGSTVFHLGLGDPFSREQLELSSPNLHSEDMQSTKAHQTFADKKACQFVRRSLRESGDFLGIQGANPRTGYWDASDVTSSSVSQASEETKRQPSERERGLLAHTRKYETSRGQYKPELKRVQRSWSKTNRESGEKKFLEVSMRRRSRGRWKLGESGWSSVAEPELSPIEQSLAGTSVIDVALGDRLFPTPSATNPAPYTRRKPFAQHNHFRHRTLSSPLPRVIRVQSQNGSSNSSQNYSASRKSVGSPNLDEAKNSSDTVIHFTSTLSDTTSHHPNPEAARAISHEITTAANMKNHAAQAPNIQDPGSFLGRKALKSESKGLRQRKAIAISYQSAGTKQVLIRPLSAQSQADLGTEKRTLFLQDLPPIFLKDPVTTQALTNFQIPKQSFQAWGPTTIIKTRPDTSTLSIDTSITTITGVDLRRNPPNNFNGPSDDTSGVQAGVHPQHQQETRITRDQNEEPKSLYQYHHLVDIATSSEHQLTQMKQRTARLYHTVSKYGQGEGMTERSNIAAGFMLPSQAHTNRNDETATALKAAQMAFMSLVVPPTPRELRKMANENRPPPPAAAVAVAPRPPHSHLIGPIEYIMVRGVVVRVRKVWRSLKPVFNATFPVRQRLQQSTWSDIALFMAAMPLVARVFLLIVSSFRLLSIALLMVTGFSRLSQVLGGF